MITGVSEGATDARKDSDVDMSPSPPAAPANGTHHGTYWLTNTAVAQWPCVLIWNNINAMISWNFKGMADKFLMVVGDWKVYFLLVPYAFNIDGC